MLLSRSSLTMLSIALPVLLLAGEVAFLAPDLLPHFGVQPTSVGAAIASPPTALISAGEFDHRRAGAFLREGHPVDGPIDTIAMADFEIMTHQVSASDYLLCVADGACDEVHGLDERKDLPVTGVSHDDAMAYAEWLSRSTGQRWRLPTDREWAYAAGSRFTDDALGVDGGSDNPAVRWLAAYRISADREAPRGPQPAGTYGINENGLVDMSGNVWEWTSACYERTTLNPDGSTKSVIDNCGVRIAEGVHRAYISSFIRDAKGGGCAAGIPPELLGFRLVSEASWWQHTVRSVLRWTGFHRG